MYNVKFCQNLRFSDIHHKTDFLPYLTNLRSSPFLKYNEELASEAISLWQEAYEEPWHVTDYIILSHNFKKVIFTWKLYVIWKKVYELSEKHTAAKVVNRASYNLLSAMERQR